MLQITFHCNPLHFFHSYLILKNSVRLKVSRTGLKFVLLLLFFCFSLCVCVCACAKRVQLFPSLMVMQKICRDPSGSVMVSCKLCREGKKRGRVPVDFILCRWGRHFVHLLMECTRQRPSFHTPMEPWKQISSRGPLNNLDQLFS